MATTVTLTWTPAGGSSLSQDVQYKLYSTTTWTTAANVGPTVATYTITGLIDNRIYDFRIVNNCAYNGPTVSTTDQDVKITCPVVTLTPTYNAVSYSFPHLGADIIRYVVALTNSTGTTIISSNTVTSMTSTITGSFTGLTPSTTYRVRITVTAKGTTTIEYSKTCPDLSFATSAPPVCNAPTSVSATMS